MKKSIHNKIVIFLTLFMSLLSVKSFALDCIEKGTNQVLKPAIPVGQLAIPADITPGTIIWESNPLQVTVYCDNVLTNIGDIVHFYFNPTEQSLGTGLLLGARYQGQELEKNQQRVSTGTNPIYPGGNVTVTVNFVLYIKVTGSVPTSGTYNGDNQFTVFQFDGTGGLNMMPGAKNLRYSVSGLRGIRFLKCGADIKVYPESQQIDFGQLLLKDLNNNQEFRKDFQIQAVKRGCLENFSMNVNFETKDKVVGETAIDLLNGTSLMIFDEDKKKVKFNFFQFFGTLPVGQSSATRNYSAVVKRTGVVSTGPFSASTVVKINYY